MKLSDILRDNGDEIESLWDKVEAAGEIGPLPKGEYVAEIIHGEATSSQSNKTPGYSLTFRVVEGEFEGRQFWHNCWLTPAAMPRSKRDLQKLGVVSLQMLDRPLPRGIRCRCTVVLRKDDKGEERNGLKTFEVIGIFPPEADPFAPDTVVNPPPGPLPALSAAAVPTNDGDLSVPS